MPIAVIYLKRYDLKNIDEQ